MTEYHWKPEDIGWVMTSAAVASLIVTLPAEAISNKRLMLVTGTLTVILATIILWHFPDPAVRW